ncbi:DUF5916 domain-containing protein [Chitinimonas sp. PSY-7]|uniref:DUF5916 domain-containing protein n=1 Tax=Chitinimonas sp. PSY-7 TaxID=3459088 RepID=UPI00403FEAE5
MAESNRGIPFWFGAISALLCSTAWSHTAINWTEAREVKLGYEIEPGDNAPAQRETTAQYLVADNTLWVRFHAREGETDKIRARIRERDNIQGDDAVGVLISPSGPGGNEAFLFWVSAAGVQMDAHWNEARQEEDSAWNARWNAEVQKEADGYSVQMGIPLTQLPLAADKHQQWAFDFRRTLPREAGYVFASQKMDRSRPCMVCRFDPVDMQLERQLTLSEFEGAVSWLETGTYRTENGATLPKKRDGNVGLDLTWRPLRGASLALALKPDFSQVESDNTRLSNNSADVFDNPEQRPFFVDVTNSFLQFQRPFYSRNIGTPDAAVFGRFSFVGGDMAMLYARDTQTTLVMPGLSGSRLATYRAADGSDLASDNLALRYRHQFDGIGQAAVSVVNRQASGYQNHLVGVDGSAQLTPRFKLDAGVLSSGTDDPNGKSSNGLASFFRLGYRDGNWSASADRQEVDEGFRADLGLMPRINFRKLNGFVRRDFVFDDNALLYRAYLQTEGWVRHDLKGELQDKVAQLAISGTGRGQTQATAWLMSREGRYQGQMFNRSGIEVALDATPVDSLKLSLQGVFSGEIDRDNVRQARQRLLKLSNSWLPSNALRFEFSASGTRVASNGETTFTERALDLRSYFFLNERSYLRAIVRDWQVERELARYINPNRPAKQQSRDWQLMYSWRPSPISTLYVGVASGRDIEQDLVNPFQAKERNWFMKLNIGFDGSGRFF